jgi:hypothetical protein
MSVQPSRGRNIHSELLTHGVVAASGAHLAAYQLRMSGLVILYEDRVLRERCNADSKRQSQAVHRHYKSRGLLLVGCLIDVCCRIV